MGRSWIFPNPHEADRQPGLTILGKNEQEFFFVASVSNVLKHAQGCHVALPSPLVFRNTPLFAIEKAVIAPKITSIIG